MSFVQEIYRDRFSAIERLLTASVYQGRAAEHWQNQPRILPDTRAGGGGRTGARLPEPLLSPTSDRAHDGGRLVNTIQLKVDSNAERSDMVLWAPTIYGSQFYMNVIVSEKNPACKTTMTAVASGWAFERNFPKILESAKGGAPWCPL
ncbi:hypothetical protein EPZ47_03750 [Pseudomonas viciae]|uniref:Uncharacterized protein n=1 Tax=Pseudomonas viciae TaxID=2505979 RepID=A0A4P7PCY7_9PSED|nr:hypothetical protein [Pseudomonas viciae]QBZ87853.1 hypothetical protein EPZ47_03750 [Pseudomonas viciae]